MSTDLQINSNRPTTDMARPVQMPVHNAPAREATAQPAPGHAAPGVDGKAVMQQMQETIKATVEKLNEQMRQSSRGLNFSIDQSLNKTVIVVKNSNTGEVIRQIPDEHLLKAAHSVEALRGLLHDSTD